MQSRIDPLSAVLLGAILLISTNARSEETLVISTFSDQRVKSPGAVELAFALPEIPKGKQIRLSLQARVDWPSLSGFNPWMVARVNGRSLEGPSLINKPLDFSTRNGVEFAWQKGDSWTILYSPDFSEEIRTRPMEWGFPDTDPYTFVWDITPYTRVGSNTVSFTHLPLLAQGSTLVLHNVRVELGEPVASRNLTTTIAPAPTGPLPTYVAQRPRPVAMKADLADGGALRVKVAGQTFAVASRTSEPAGQWRETTDGKWLSLRRDKSATAHWSGTDYRVTRTVTLRADHVHVADTISNTADRLIGVIYENRLDIAALGQPEILLGGRPPCSPAGSESPFHPSAIATSKDLAIGIFAEDDIFRIHHRAFADNQTIGLADSRLGIAPGQSHTLEWSFYPVVRGDYWDVINAVRRNWGSNIPIPGPGIFDHPNDGSRPLEFYQQKIQSRGLKLAFTGQTDFQGDEIQKLGGGIVDLGEGTAIPLAKRWCANAAAWVKKMHAADPSVKTFVYMHPTICTEPGAEKLYADSKLLDAAGTHLTSPYRYPVYMYLSTRDNSYGKAYLQTFETILREINPDGIFMDEIAEGSVPRYAYRTAWDGCTVGIDPKTHAVTGQYSSTVLLMQSWKTAIVNRLRERGGLLVGNGPCHTRTMLGWRMPMLHETGSYSFLQDMHLCTPWGLGNHDNDNNDRVRSRMVRRFLDYAAVLCTYSWGDQPQGFHYLQTMFPITPVELHPGMILGEERIVTNRSGRYGWLDGRAAKVYVFDGDGKLVENPQVRAVGRRLTEVRMPSDHFAVLVRK